MEKIMIRLISFLLVVSTVSEAFDGDSITVQRLIDHEMRLDYLEKMENIRKTEFTNFEKSAKNDFESFVLEVRRNNRYIGIISTLLSFLFIGGGFILFFNFKNYADKKGKEILGSALKKNEIAINELLMQENEEHQLRTKKRILVVTPQYSDNEFIRRFFREMSFNPANIHYETFKDNIPEGKYDLVLFNDETGGDGSNDDEENIKRVESIEWYLQKFSSKTIRLYFGNEKLFSDVRFEKDRTVTSFVNTRLQLYGNLMNALKYQDKML